MTAGPTEPQPGGYPQPWSGPPPGPLPGPLPGPPPGPPEPPPGRRGPFGLRPAPPPPPHKWGIGAFVVVELVFLGVSLLVGYLIPTQGSVAGILAALVVPTVLAAGTAVVWTYLRGNGPALDLGLRWSWDDVGIGLIIGLLGLVLTVPAALVYASIVGPEGATTAVGDVFAGVRTSWPMALLVMFVVVIVAPICEEIMYRGLLWGAVAKHVPNRPVVIYLVTTLLFAFAHFELTRTPLLFVVALPLGLARMLTGRLGAGVLAHQVNNFLPGLALALMLVGVVQV
ncbi:MAG: CPBP family intramembrane metalloprotease [Pseudonocardia sp.]|nr:CPBP family intramembrane metalloprotease [Pseudonocardia sp.]